LATVFQAEDVLDVGSTAFYPKKGGTFRMFFVLILLVVPLAMFMRRGAVPAEPVAAH
jgi:hypothetical protein